MRRPSCLESTPPWTVSSDRTALQNEPVRFTGPVKVIIALTAPDQRKRDLDNFAGKALLDVLTHLGVWDDDSQVHDLHSWWADKPRKPGQAVITIEDL